MTTSEWTKKFIVIILDMMTLNCVTDKAELAHSLTRTRRHRWQCQDIKPGMWGVLNFLTCRVMIQLMCVYRDKFDDISSAVQIRLFSLKKNTKKTEVNENGVRTGFTHLTDSWTLISQFTISQTYSTPLWYLSTSLFFQAHSIPKF